MVVQSNIPAINAHRNLGINNSALSKNLEKLSSGYKINRAGDDAAGLAISEKMRSQIRGLEMAEQNTENAISLIQTAEGGLNETHAILQRMRELAVQSVNGTYTQEDRDQITLEYEALKSEITRIADSTHYNGIKLLNGNLTDGYAVTTNTNLANAAAAGITKVEFTGAVDGSGTGPGLGKDFSGATYEIRVADDGTISGNVNLADGTSLTLSGTATAGTALTITFNNTGGIAGGGGGSAGADAKLEITVGTLPTTGESTVVSGTLGTLANVADGTTAGTSDVTATAGYVTRISSTGARLTFQIGANGDADQKVDLQVADMAAAMIGLDDGNGGIVANSSVQDSSVANPARADTAINILDDAIMQVSAQRAGLGALQNRLEHTLNSLGVSKENLTAAESTIRDTDMAKEMMKFTQNSILVQASQAMLAQANALPQGILSLLS